MEVKKLSDEMHQRILGWTPTPMNRRALAQIQETLAPFNLDKAQDHSDATELPLPKNLGTYQEVLDQAITTYGSKHLLKLKNLANADLPELPSEKPQRHHGWLKWSMTSWEVSKAPEDDNKAQVLDFETVRVQQSDDPLDIQWLPTCCVVFSNNTWYVWQADLNNLEPYVSYSKNQTIAGHNCPYDRSYLAEEYQIKDTGNRFYDTMAAWISVRGLTNQQRLAYKQHQKDPFISLEWADQTGTNGLDAVYEFYTGKLLDKGVRNSIEAEGLPWMKQNLTEVVWYCIRDVLATLEVFRYVFPEHLRQQPEASFTGQLLLGSAWVPLSRDRWYNYYDNAESKAKEAEDKIRVALDSRITELISTYCPYGGLSRDQILKYVPELSPENTKATNTKLIKAWEKENVFKPIETNDPWLKQLDWTLATTGVNRGLPAWYRGLKEDYTAKAKIIPLILGVTYLGKPVMFLGDHKTGSWVTEDGQIQHPDERDKRVTNLFSKGFEKLVEDGVLSAFGDLKELLAGLMSLVNWTSLRKRVKALKVHNPQGFPVCVPRITVTGTVTRRCADNVWMVASNPKAKRIGTELKSMIEAPEGYKIVGADISSQEMYLASALGDSVLGYCGSTPIGLMTLVGTKSDGTDPHSVVAKEVEVSRDIAKVLVYGALYGQGFKGTYDVLRRNLVADSDQSCKDKANKFLSVFKGTKSLATGRLQDGLATEAFNKMGAIANQDIPKTPILGATMTKALAGFVDFKTTRVNWVVQSSGCDFRDLLIVYAKYFYDFLGVDGRLILNIHDEIRTLVKNEDTIKAAYALQLAHLYTRAFIIDALGLDCIPVGIAYFPDLDIDTVIRKEVDQPQITPSQPNAIPSGVSLSPKKLKEILDAVMG